jgi:hypothetical protein
MSQTVVDKPNIDELKKSKSNFITRSSYFKKLCKGCFDICDGSKTGSINKAELYAAVLLVHLKMAKYAGPAACYPAPRERVDQLFEASDDDNSGEIDEVEFENVAIITAASISSRVITYYAFIILLVPYLAARIIDLFDIIRVVEGILKIDAMWYANAPAWAQHVVDMVPDTVWLTLPEQIISLFFVSSTQPTVHRLWF